MTMLERPTTDLASATLPELAAMANRALAEVNRQADAMNGAAVAGIRAAIAAGAALNAALDRVPRGQWERWVADNIDRYTINTVRVYRKLDLYDHERIVVDTLAAVGAYATCPACGDHVGVTCDGPCVACLEAMAEEDR